MDIEHINHMIKFLGEEISNFKHIENPENHIHTAAICEAKSLFTGSMNTLSTTVVTTKNKIYRKNGQDGWTNIPSPLDDIDENLAKAGNLL